MPEKKIQNWQSYNYQMLDDWVQSFNDYKPVSNMVYWYLYNE